MSILPSPLFSLHRHDRLKYLKLQFLLIVALRQLRQLDGNQVSERSIFVRCLRGTIKTDRRRPTPLTRFTHVPRRRHRERRRGGNKRFASGNQAVRCSLGSHCAHSGSMRHVADGVIRERRRVVSISHRAPRVDLVGCRADTHDTRSWPGQNIPDQPVAPDVAAAMAAGRRFVPSGQLRTVRVESGRWRMADGRTWG